ncbi:MAG: hypothetical protein WD963_02055 [Candidatus Paceibacterota bacterium]
MIMFGEAFWDSLKNKQQKEKPHFALPQSEKEEIRINAGKGSLARLIYKTSMQYLNMDVSLQEKSTDNELLMLIFDHPVIWFFQMIDDYPNLDDLALILEIGSDLEENNLLPPGITKKSYARCLQSEIKRQEKLVKSENQDEFEEYKQELTELTNEGFSPLTDEEATPLIEEVIAKILMKK